mmetsp:Transcript_12824/g.26427  ORF Transcript_12824/g.26427 Transcript_12824/m.26427 type:complete len:445 (+) Transcript_12824:148-1482(+)
MATSNQDTKSEGAHATDWLGVNVVLLDGEDPEAPHKRVSPPPKSNPAAAVFNGTHPSGPIVRRKESGQQEHYGWLRQLDLRLDVPDMDEILSWDFDVLLFEENVLVEVFLKLLDYYKLVEKFGMDRAMLKKYCLLVMNRHYKDCFYHTVVFGGGEEKEERIEADYQTLCEYHNWYHAVSCAHASFLFLSLGEADQYLSSEEIFAIIMGALIHDMDHPGTNNDFEVKRNSTLAKQYANDAVLERQSITAGLEICKEQPELDWLKFFQNEETRDLVETYLKECILATDPARHACVIQDALLIIENGQKFQNDKNEPTYLDKNDPFHRTLIGRIIVHCADISNPLHSSFEVARDWAVRVTTEFSRQASREKELNLPVTTFMDGIDSEYKIAKLQIGFFGFMVKPLFHTAGLLFPKSSHLEDWGEDNCDGYREVIKKYEEEHNITPSS